MIVKENIEIGGKDFVKQYSDGGFYIARDGAKYSDAIDPAEFGRTYTETDVPIERDGVEYSEVIDPADILREYTETDKPIEGEPQDEAEQKAEAYDYLTGRSNGNE